MANLVGNDLGTLVCTDVRIDVATEFDDPGLTGAHRSSDGPGESQIPDDINVSQIDVEDVGVIREQESGVVEQVPM